MANKGAKKIYREAKENAEFHNDLKSVGEKKYKPSIFWDRTDKVLYAAAYTGWLIAKGQYIECNYDD